jgi:hypothetical protein
MGSRGTHLRSGRNIPWWGRVIEDPARHEGCAAPEFLEEAQVAGIRPVVRHA